MVDYDYLDQLTDEEKVWLASFSEEYYKGWRMRAETQVQPLEHLRSSNAAYFRLRKSGDPLSFPGHRHDMNISGAPHDDRGHDRLGTNADGDTAVQLRMLAGSRGQDEHELRGRNTTEDDMIRWLDRPKLVRKPDK